MMNSIWFLSTAKKIYEEIKHQVQIGIGETTLPLYNYINMYPPLPC